MLHLLTGSLAANTGSDAFRLHEAFTQLRAELDSDGMLSSNTTTLAPRGLAPAEVIQHLSTIPFLAAARLVVIEGLLLALGSRRGATEQWQPLLDFLPLMPETNHLVILEPLPDREDRVAVERSPMLRALRGIPGADVREFRELRLRGQNGNEVARWVLERAAIRGVAIERDAADALAELIGANLWAIASEIDKLGQYADGRPVTIEDVRALTTAARQAGMFDLVDAAVEGRTPAALRLLRDLLDEASDPPQVVLVMIARQLRNLVRAAELIEARAAQPEIASATGVTNQYALTKLLRQAGSLGRAAAERGLREAEATDHAIKTGDLTDELALELLVCRLGELAPGPASRR
jgi:DNA polymerase-3 subunit delta